MEEMKLNVVDHDDPNIYSSIVTDTPVKKVEIIVTAEEQEMVFSGIRPEGMRQDVFKKVRKDLDKAVKLYKGGKYKHVSSVSPLMKGFKDMPEGKGAYVRTEPKRYEK